MICLVQLTTTDLRSRCEKRQREEAHTHTRTENAAGLILPAAMADASSGRCASVETDLLMSSEPESRARLNELVGILPQIAPSLPLASVHSLIKVLAPLVAENSAFAGTDAGAGKSSAHARVAEADAARTLTTLAASGTAPAAAAPSPTPPSPAPALAPRDPHAPLAEILAGAHPCGPWFTDVLAQSLVIRPTHDGRCDGLYTEAVIAAGVHVVIYGGQLQSEAPGDARHALRLAGCDRFVDGADARSLPLTHAAALTNSSTHPNCRLVHLLPANWPREWRLTLPGVPVLVAIREIGAGEELLWRYSFSNQSHARDNRDDLALAVVYLIGEVAETDPAEALVFATGAWRDVCTTTRAYAHDAVQIALLGYKIDVSFLSKLYNVFSSPTILHPSIGQPSSAAAAVRVNGRCLANGLQRDLASPRLTPSMRRIARNVRAWHPLRLHLLADMCERHNLKMLGAIVGERGGSVESLEAYEQTEEHQTLILSAIWAVTKRQPLNFPGETPPKTSLSELLDTQRFNVNYAPWIVFTEGVPQVRGYSPIQDAVQYNNEDALRELLANGADIHYFNGGCSYAPCLAITRCLPRMLELLLPYVDFGVTTIFGRSLLHEMMFGCNRRDPAACLPVVVRTTDLMQRAFRMQRTLFKHLYRRFPNPAELLAFIDKKAEDGTVALDALLCYEGASSYRRVGDGHLRVLPLKSGLWIRWHVLLLCVREHTLRRVGERPSALAPLTAGEANMFSTAASQAASAADIHFDHVFKRNLPHDWSREPWLHVDVDRWLTD